MSESKCPECDTYLIELSIVNQNYSVDTWVWPTNPIINHYGYWCPKCKKMYEKTVSAPTFHEKS